MTKALIEIDLDNAAFENQRELVRILTKLAKDIDASVVLRPLAMQDINGNKVGTFKIVDTTDF